MAMWKVLKDTSQRAQKAGRCTFAAEVSSEGQKGVK